MLDLSALMSTRQYGRSVGLSTHRVSANPKTTRQYVRARQTESALLFPRLQAIWACGILRRSWSGEHLKAATGIKRLSLRLLQTPFLLSPYTDTLPAKKHMAVLERNLLGIAAL